PADLRRRHREQLDFEDERGAGWDDATGTAISVPKVRRNHELSLSADAHRADALVPALDDAPFANREDQRLAAIVRRVELLTLLHPAGVGTAGGSARLGRAAAG